MSHSTATLAPPQQTAKKPLVRYTNGRPSFVHTMAVVWRHRLLTPREVLWRWTVGLPLLALLGWKIAAAAPHMVVDSDALENMSAFKAVAAVHAMTAAFQAVFTVLWPTLLWWIPLALVLWSVAAGLGRTWVWRKLDPALHRRPGTMMVLSGVRMLGLLAVLAAWLGIGAVATHFAILAPPRGGMEPSVVLFCGIVIVGSLALFMVWCVTGWLLDAALPLAMEHNLGAAAALWRSLRLRGERARLIETNLVMGISRVALIILGMVACACPLPFETVATQKFLYYWWAGVVLVYFVATDYFKVVRAGTYLLSLPPENAAEQIASEKIAAS